MKETILNALFFLLGFIVVLLVFLASYFLYMSLVPGGSGLIFVSPFASALIPALLSGFLVAQTRTVKHPGNFLFSSSALFFLSLMLLLWALPLIFQTQLLRDMDQSPLVSQRFLSLADGTKLYSPSVQTKSGQFNQNVVLIPEKGERMNVVPEVQFDPLQKKFYFPNTEQPALLLEENGPERAYFGFPRVMESFQFELFTLYQAFKMAWEKDYLYFSTICLLVSLLFVGIFFVYSFPQWPLFQVFLVLLTFRILLWYLSFCLFQVPAILTPWIGASAISEKWAPASLLALTAVCFVFLTIVIKPHQRKTME